MEVDSVEVLNRVDSSTDCAKFGNLKAFVNVAREFEATHSDSAINLMTRYLGLIASSCDLSIFSPGRTEVCAFFSSLWRVMNDNRGPHWTGVAVLARACIEPSARHALIHTYKFMPILARLLTDSISNEKKLKLLSVMQDISYGIKISWQESYLTTLMKQLTTFIREPMFDPQLRAIGQKSLTVLVNLCYGNLPAIYSLMRTVDTKEFVKHLISLKDGGYGGVEVCRLLLCVWSGTRGAGAARQHDVHSYLCCTLNTLNKAMLERDATQLLHAYTFIKDLCTDANLRAYVLTYPNFNSALTEALKGMKSLCEAKSDDNLEQETFTDCLSNALKLLTVILNLELYSLRSHHCQLVSLCVETSRVCLPETLELFGAVVSQYRDEGRLPEDLLNSVCNGLATLSAPPAVDPGKTGLPWLQALGALCETCETQERVLQEVSPESFEDTLYSLLQYTSQNGQVGSEQGQQAVIVGCRIALSLAPQRPHWEAALVRLLSHHEVRKMLCTSLMSNNANRRRHVLQLIKHHYFPSDQMNQVFGEGPFNQDASSEGASPRSNCSVTRQLNNGSTEGDGDTVTTSWLAATLAPHHERAIDQLIATLGQHLANNTISDIATSSVMELYGYKMTCLEQRLHSHSVALQGATEHMASLQHALAMLQATNSSQQDVLYTTQMQSEKNKKTIEQLTKELEEAETTIRGFRAKMAAERLDRENQRERLLKEFKAETAKLESEWKARERAAEERLRQAESEHEKTRQQLQQMTNKSTELAGVLIKFEERVKERNKRLEEASAAETALRKEMDHKDQTIKQLEKTVVERENRLYQVTSQLEEMKRVQEMVAKLMAKTSAQTS